MSQVAIFKNEKMKKCEKKKNESTYGESTSGAPIMPPVDYNYQPQTICQSSADYRLLICWSFLFFAEFSVLSNELDKYYLSFHP